MGLMLLYVYLSTGNEENRWITSDKKIKEYLTSKKEYRIEKRE